MKDEAHPGCSVETIAPEMIEKIHRIVMEDRRIKVRVIVEVKIRVQNFTSSTLFSWFSSFWLLFIPKPQDLARVKEIFVWRQFYRRYEWVF